MKLGPFHISRTPVEVVQAAAEPTGRPVKELGASGTLNPEPLFAPDGVSA